jgi:hypothetical protein
MSASSQAITIDGRKYDIDALTDTARAQIRNLHVCDAEIARLEGLLAIMKTARGTYARALGVELDRAAPT